MKKGEMLSKAIVIATNAHAGQFDRGGRPYVLHSLRVMSYLKDDDEELQCVAVLHDVIEDTNTTWSDLIDAGMSDRVISALKLLTKLPGQTYSEYKEGVFSSVDAMKVKKCDLRHNSDLRRLKGISDKDIARNAKYQVFFFEIESKLS